MRSVEQHITAGQLLVLGAMATYCIDCTLPSLSLHPGALIAAVTDLTFNLRGYLAVLTNDVLTSLYLIMVKDTPTTGGLSTTGAAGRPAVGGTGASGRHDTA